MAKKSRLASTCSPRTLGALHVGERHHAPEQEGQLVVLAEEAEVEVVDPQDGQGKVERGVDGHAHGQGLGGFGDPFLDHPLAPLLHEVAQSRGRYRGT